MEKRSLETLSAIVDERYFSQEKAIEKAYEAQQSWNETHNDLTRKMEKFVTRTELWTLIAVIVSLFGLYLIK